MSAFILPWLALASIQIVATMSPGPAFALCVRNAIAHHRKAGIMTALGLGLGVSLHVLFVMLGASAILKQAPMIFEIIKYAGAIYLIYIGAKSILTAKPTKDKNNQNETAKNPARKSISFIQEGFLTNALNPKAWVFFPIVFVQFITPQTPYFILTLYGSTLISIEILWFCILTLFLTNQALRKRFLSIAHWIERACGGLLIALGVKLIFDKGLKAI